MVWQVRLLLCDTLSGTSGAIRVSPILVAAVRLHDMPPDLSEGPIIETNTIEKDCKSRKDND